MSRSFGFVGLALVTACAAPRIVAPLRYLDPPTPSPDTPFRATPPPLAQVTETSLPAAQVTTLSNGMRLAVLQTPGATSVSVRLVIPRDSFDPADPAGVLLEQMEFLFRRAGEAGTRSLVHRDPGSGAWARESIRPDALEWTGHGPADALSLVAELVARRSFGASLTAAEYDRRGREWLAEVHRGFADYGRPEQFVLFGDRHPYGYGGWGRNLISLADATQRRAALLQPARATLVVAGPDPEAVVAAIAQRWFGGLTASAPALPLTASAPPPPQSVGAQLIYVPSWGNRQTGLIVGQGPSGDAAEVDALMVLECLLAAPGSTLYDEVRGEQGATYSVGGYLQRHRFATWIAIGGEYLKGKELDALGSGLELLRQVRTGDIADDELERARQEALASWRMGLATVDGVTEVYAQSMLLGDDWGALTDRPSRLARLSRDELARVTKAYFAPDRLHVIVAGGPSGFQERKLGLGGALQVNLPR